MSVGKEGRKIGSEDRWKEGGRREGWSREERKRWSEEGRRGKGRMKTDGAKLFERKEGRED